MKCPKVQMCKLPPWSIYKPSSVKILHQGLIFFSVFHGIARQRHWNCLRAGTCSSITMSCKMKCESNGKQAWGIDEKSMAQSRESHSKIMHAASDGLIFSYGPIVDMKNISVLPTLTFLSLFSSPCLQTSHKTLLWNIKHLGQELWKGDNFHRSLLGVP